MNSKRLWQAGCLMVLLVLAAGCGGTAAPTSSGSASASPTTAQSTRPQKKRLIPVSFRLPWVANGASIPYVVAEEKGYFKAAGYNVTVGQGKGSGATTETVGNGSDQMGNADASTVAKLISKGVPVKVIAVYEQESPAAFFYDPAKTTLKSASDLVGKTIIHVPGDALTQLLPAVLDKNHVNPSAVKYIAVSSSTIHQAAASHPQDIVLDQDTAAALYEKLIPGETFKRYAAFGVNVYSEGLVTNLQMIQKHPGEVKALVAAINKGWKFSLQHPNQAAALLRKAFPTAPAVPTLVQEFRAASSGMHTASTQGHPLGWMSQADWKETIALLHQYAGLKNVKPLGAYYSDAFIPGAASGQ